MQNEGDRRCVGTAGEVQWPDLFFLLAAVPGTILEKPRKLHVDQIARSIAYGGSMVQPNTATSETVVDPYQMLTVPAQVA
jgi:hypothetical protein